jgi:hypothetical protein
LSANDVLRLEDMDDIGDQGDVYMVPANMADAETGEPFGKTEAPQQPGPPSSEEDEQSTTLNWLRPGLVTELTKIIRLEGNKVQKAAKRTSKDESYNFLGFLDDFYDSEFITICCENLQALSSVVASVSSDVLEIENTVAVYAAESKEFWLDVSQTSTRETLYLDVTERLGKWSDRACLAADMILEANNG